MNTNPKNQTPDIENNLIRYLKADYGIETIMLTPLSLGADMNASLYKAQAPDNLSYFLKLKRGRQDDVSSTLLSLLHDKGIQQVISPIKTTQGQSSLHINNDTLTVYPYIEGENGFNCLLTDDQWLTLGTTMRQIHELEIPPSIQKRIRRETYSSKWREAVRSLYSQIDDNLNNDDIAIKLKLFMKTNRKTISKLVDRSEQLAKELQELSPEFVLCHSDIHAGNVLIKENGSIFIVDWDDPIMAPKERDLMFIGGGVANIWNNPHEEELFYRGYGKTEMDKTILAYYRHERIVEDIAEYGQSLLLTPIASPDGTEMYKHFLAMFEPNGVVDIAFKT